MGKIIDFNCTFDDGGGVPESVMKKYNLKFPDAYKTCEFMVSIAKGIREEKGVEYSLIPFCHTVEGEAMGGDINLGNEIAGPRAKTYAFDNIDDLSNLQDIDFSKGRIGETLKAVKILAEDGENPILMLNGPFTILNALIDPKYVFKAMRKTPEKIDKIFNYLKRNLSSYIEEGKKAGVRLFSYADSTGGVNILGPKMAEDVARNFTYLFLKGLDIGDGNSLLLCPKTSFALIGTGLAKWGEIDLGEEMTYGEACIKHVGEYKFAGEMCIKNTNYVLKSGKLKELILL
ncbi:MAG: methylcobamide--CoM methyltransferase [Tissierellia bacterium]|nr:methylcobamide--CoM methyltransferase [Tissierellia bacterium]